MFVHVHDQNTDAIIETFDYQPIEHREYNPSSGQQPQLFRNEQSESELHLTKPKATDVGPKPATKQSKTRTTLQFKELTTKLASKEIKNSNWKKASKTRTRQHNSQQHTMQKHLECEKCFSTSGLIQKISHKLKWLYLFDSVATTCFGLYFFVMFTS